MAAKQLELFWLFCQYKCLISPTSSAVPKVGTVGVGPETCYKLYSIFLKSKIEKYRFFKMYCSRKFLVEVESIPTE